MLKQELKELSNHCFELEESLPIFNYYGSNQEDTDAQALRKELYRIRCEIGRLRVIYEKI